MMLKTYDIAQWCSVLLMHLNDKLECLSKAGIFCFIQFLIIIIILICQKDFPEINSLAYLAPPSHKKTFYSSVTRIRSRKSLFFPTYKEAILSQSNFSWSAFPTYAGRSLPKWGLGLTSFTVVTHEYQTVLERFAGYKRSSLFCLIFCDTKKFYNIHTRSQCRKSFFATYKEAIQLK